MAEDAFVTDFEHIMADDITDDVRFIMYDSASGKTASTGEVRKYIMANMNVRDSDSDGHIVFGGEQ